MGDDPDRGEREKLSWSEIDKLRDRARSPRGDSPRGRRGQQQAEHQKRGALQSADALFSGDPGGEEGAALAKAVRDAHGTPELEQACRDYVAALGMPTSTDLLSVFLDVRRPDLVVAALEKLSELKHDGKLKLSSGFRSQLRVLALEPDDRIAGLSEDLLE